MYSDTISTIFCPYGNQHAFDGMGDLRTENVVTIGPTTSRIDDDLLSSSVECSVAST